MDLAMYAPPPLNNTITHEISARSERRYYGLGAQLIGWHKAVADDLARIDEAVRRRAIQVATEARHIGFDEWKQTMHATRRDRIREVVLANGGMSVDDLALATKYGHKWLANETKAMVAAGELVACKVRASLRRYKTVFAVAEERNRKEFTERG